MIKFKEFLSHLYRFTALFLFVLCVSFIPSNIAYATTPASASPDNTIKLSSYRKKLTKKTTYTIKVKGLGYNQKASFKSQNKSIATVNSKGKVTAKQIGSTKIIVTITQGDTTIKTLSVSIIVGKNAYSISLISKNYITLEIGQKKYLKTSIKPKDSAETPIYRSTVPSVATISPSGLIQAKSEGETTIYATLANKKYVKCLVTVTNSNTNKQGIPPETYKPKKRSEGL